MEYQIPTRSDVKNKKYQLLLKAKKYEKHLDDSFKGELEHFPVSKLKGLLGLLGISFMTNKIKNKVKILIKDYDDIASFENDKNTLAGKLFLEHKRIAEESDIYTSFDESSWIIKNKNNPDKKITAVYFHRMDSIILSLEDNFDLRSEVDKLLEEKEKIIVNGIRLKKSYASHLKIKEKNDPEELNNTLMERESDYKFLYKKSF